MVTLSDKSKTVSALSTELEILEAEQLCIDAMQAFLIIRQTALSAKYDGVQNALNKLLK